jgi:hypothetical protein
MVGGKMFDFLILFDSGLISLAFGYAHLFQVAKRV